MLYFDIGDFRSNLDGFRKINNVKTIPERLS